MGASPVFSCSVALLVVFSAVPAAIADDRGRSVDVGAGARPEIYLYDHQGTMVGHGRRAGRGAATYLFGGNGRVSGWITPGGSVHGGDGSSIGLRAPRRDRFGGLGRDSPFARRP